MWSLLPDIKKITFITGCLKAIVVLIYQCDFIYLFTFGFAFHSVWPVILG